MYFANRQLRNVIVPNASKAYNLTKLMAAIDEYMLVSGKKGIMIQYIMLHGVNDSLEAAEELSTLIKGKCSLLNLIPYNPTEVPDSYETSTWHSILSFQSYMRKQGILTTIRQEMGSTVDGACGQLALTSRGKSSSEYEW